MKITYRRWPASAWYVQVYYTEDPETAAPVVLDYVQIMHVSHTDPVHITGEDIGSIRALFPEATQDEYDDLAAALGEVRTDHKLAPVVPKKPVPKTNPDELDLPDM